MLLDSLMLLLRHELEIAWVLEPLVVAAALVVTYRAEYHLRKVDMLRVMCHFHSCEVHKFRQVKLTTEINLRLDDLWHRLV
jgi:hypothetical protein